MKDNALAKWIRPSTLVWFVFMFSAFAILDGNIGTFTVKDLYIKSLSEVLQALIVVYVLGRSGEKITDKWKGSSNDPN